MKSDRYAKWLLYAYTNSSAPNKPSLYNDTPVVEIPSGGNLPTYGNIFLQPLLIKVTLKRKLTQLWKLFLLTDEFPPVGDRLYFYFQNLVL